MGKKVKYEDKMIRPDDMRNKQGKKKAKKKGKKGR